MLIVLLFNKMKIKIAVISMIFLIPLFVWGGPLTITLENDFLAEADRHYTHGTRFMYVFDEMGGDENERGNLATQLYICSLFGDKFDSNEKDNYWGVVLAQYIYTPSDISIVELMVDDRPYAGWLYLGCIFFARDNYWQDLVEFDVGIIGPYSLAECTQTEIHKLIDSTIPMGWANQLGTELGINVSYQKKYRYRYKDIFDVIPSVGGSLGNIATYMDVGCSLRLGYNLPDDFGFLRIEPTIRENEFGWGVYVFGDVEGRCVARNIFLDGNTFKKSHHVAKEIFVADLSIGLGVICGNFDFIYAYSFRTKEFYKQKEDNEFGTLSFCYEF